MINNCREKRSKVGKDTNLMQDDEEFDRYEYRYE